MTANSIDKYMSENRKWLEELVISGNRIIRVMALAVLEVKGDSDKLDQYSISFLGALLLSISTFILHNIGGVQ